MTGRWFCRVVIQGDGTADVYLTGGLDEADLSNGLQNEMRLVRGVEYWDGLEMDVRARFRAWWEAGEILPKGG